KTAVFQGASEDEIGVLIRLAGVTWAGRALGVTAQPPAFTVDDVRTIAHAAHALEESGEPEPRPETGIGRPIDRLLGEGVPAEVRAKLAPLAEYLVSAARELAEMREGEFDALYPAAAALASAGGESHTGETLVNAALEEHMAAAGLTPGGKVWMR